MDNRKPIALTEQQARKLELDPDRVILVKKGDCAFYNQCLNVAEKQCWPGFGCTACTAYQAMDSIQRELDWEGLSMLIMVGENLDKTGRVDRKRGVKPGAENKKCRNLPVIGSYDEQELEQERQEMLAEIAADQQIPDLMESDLMEEDAPLVDAFPQM